MATCLYSNNLLTFGDYLGCIPSSIVICSPVPNSLHDDIHVLIIKSNPFEVPLFDHLHADSMDSLAGVDIDFGLYYVLDCILLFNPKRLGSIFESELDARQVFVVSLLLVVDGR